jgi:hypothetical protein
MEDIIDAETVPATPLEVSALISKTTGKGSTGQL